MREALTDFIKNASLFTVLHFFITTLVLVVGVALMLVRGRVGGIWFLVIGFIAALSGILAWYFANDIADHRLAMFGPLSDAGAAAVRREALIDLIVGLAGAGVLLGLRMWRLHNYRKTITK
jgi:hypothetical protein